MRQPVKTWAINSGWRSWGMWTLNSRREITTNYDHYRNSNIRVRKFIHLHNVYTAAIRGGGDERREKSAGERDTFERAIIISYAGALPAPYGIMRTLRFALRCYRIVFERILLNVYVHIQGGQNKRRLLHHDRMTGQRTFSGPRTIFLPSPSKKCHLWSCLILQCTFKWNFTIITRDTTDAIIKCSVRCLRIITIFGLSEKTSTKSYQRYQSVAFAYVTDCYFCLLYWDVINSICSFVFKKNLNYYLFAHI